MILLMAVVVLVLSVIENAGAFLVHVRKGSTLRLYGANPVPVTPVLTDFDQLEAATGDLTIEQLNEEKADRERESIGLDKILERAMSMLGKCPTFTLVSLIAKYKPDEVANLSEKDKNDMEVLCPLALDTVWRSTKDLSWESFFTLLQEELKDEMPKIDAYMNEAILYVNEFPESFIKKLITKYENSNAVPRKDVVFRDNKGGKIHYTAALIAILLAQNGNDYADVVKLLKTEAARVESKGFGMQS